MPRQTIDIPKALIDSYTARIGIRDDKTTITFQLDQELQEDEKQLIKTIVEKRKSISLRINWID